MEKTYQRINWENEPSTVTPLNEDNLNRIDYAVDVIDTRVVELGSYREDAMQSAESSRENATLSQSYADNAKYYKEQAETASRNVESAVVDVNTAVSSATLSARNAKESEDNSKISETNAKDSENKAKESENNAKVSEDNAKTSEDNAKTSEDNANSASEIAQNAVTSISSYMETIETAVESASASADRAQEIADSIDYDYTNMRNKPSINGHELVGNLTTEDLDISAEPEGYSELVTTVGTHTTELSTLSENVTQLNDDLTQTIADVSAHDTAIADLAVEQATQASNISNLDIEVAKKANKTEIPTVNNGTLTIQKNGSNVTTFTANQSSNATANIIVPDGAISDAYSSSTTYAVGQFCLYNNSLWKCKTQCKGQTPAENSYWTKRSLGQEIKQINTDLSAISEKDIGGVAFYSNIGITNIEGYMSGFGPFAILTYIVDFESLTNNSGMYIGGLTRNNSYPLKRVALTCHGVGGADTIKNPNVAYLDTDGRIYIVPKFSDTGARIIISGIWRIK